MKKQKNPLFNLLKTEWKYLLERKKLFIFVMVLFTIAGLISLVNPLILGLIFNSIQNTISSQADLKKLIFLIFSLLFLNIGFWMFHGVARYFEVRNGFYVGRNYTNSKISKVLELPIKWHKDHHSGDTIDKINTSASGITSFSDSLTFQIMYAVINVFGSLIILFFVDYRAAIFALVYSIVVLFIIFKLDKKLIGYYKEMNEKHNKVAAGIYDYLSNILTIITLRLKKTVVKEIDSRIMASDELNKKSARLNEIKWGFASISITLMTVIILSYRAYDDFTKTGIILVGTLYILYGYLSRVGDTFYSFADLYGTITKQNAGIVNAYPIEEAFKEIKEEIKLDLPKDWNKIDLKNMSFAYDKDGKLKHLNNIDFSFSKGQKIALVGESGSGKSTVLSLLRGLYEPDKGEVYCNGKKIDHGFARLKKHVTLIPQDPELFNNTIRYNITMDLPVNDNDLKKVIEMARFKIVVDRLEKGLNTNVLERGVSLSGGEKQRLALARGLLAARKSEIVLLDEPTSSVDSMNEMKIHESIFKDFKNKTIISSIHRLHLLDKFDYVYMFEKGKIVAHGSLEQIKKNPKFEKIWRKYGLNREIKKERLD